MWRVRELGPLLNWIDRKPFGSNGILRSLANPMRDDVAGRFWSAELRPSTLCF
ncbi:hypothetical protein SAMN04488037_11613 [Shimia marina]|uniref:Uncharacterized protein n=1 Tax=Shimia marina TaxID=321267 RepID=A0A0P1ENY1_9RHOB|nr:hypothetical protein SHM7688_01145 [Shimia marina]SFE69693.1 hypothetical protein SAMN04488037_11613 [Shimia marina]